MYTPKIYFNEIARILKSAGTFVFVVPNFNSLMCRVSKRDDIARHIYQFTPKSIANYLRTSGFSSWNIQFDDTFFDGRGTGAVMALFGSKRPFRWLDRIIFNFHWEKYLRIGSTMLITATK